MNHRLLVALLLCAGLLSGCFHSTTGKEIDPLKVNTIQTGKTTEAQMVEMFGEPMTWSDGSDGTRTLNWNYNRRRSDITSLSDSNKLDRLTATVRGGVVESYKYQPSGGQGSSSSGKYKPQAPTTQK